jgi:hypothetical protein
MNRFCGMFSQLLQLLPRHGFHQAVKKTRAERHARGFSGGGQFVVMLLCHLGPAHSLREIIGGLRSCEGKLKHLGIAPPTAPPSSTRTNTAPGPSIKNSSGCFSIASMTKESGTTSSGLKTNSSVWIPPSSIFPSVSLTGSFPPHQRSHQVRPPFEP